MNTLNYKVLLVKTVFQLFTRAIGIYLLITIPAIAANPFMYLISATYAVSFGWIAAALFLLFFYIVYKMKYDAFVKNIFLYGSVALAVAVAYQMMEILGVEDRIWHSDARPGVPSIRINLLHIPCLRETSTVKRQGNYCFPKHLENTHLIRFIFA